MIFFFRLCHAFLWKDWCWSWSSNTLATWCEELTHLKRPWCWERLKVGGEGDDRGWDGWMASLTQWTWAWVNSGSWWWTGRLASCRPRGHKESDSTEQLNWTELTIVPPGVFERTSLLHRNKRDFWLCMNSDWHHPNILNVRKQFFLFCFVLFCSCRKRGGRYYHW